MQRITAAITAAMLALLLGFASTASAQTVPPDNSGADQYAEGVPGAEGNKPTGSGGGSAGGSGGSGEGGGLPSGVVSELEGNGALGAAAAAALNASAPGSGGSGQPGADNDRSGAGAAGPEVAGADGTAASADAGGGTIGELADALVGESDSGMGALLPVLLVLVVLGAVLLLAVRRRHQDGSPVSDG